MRRLKPLRLADIPGELVTVAEYAVLTRITARYAYEQARRGDIPTVRQGSRVFIPRWYVEQVCQVGASRLTVAP